MMPFRTIKLQGVCVSKLAVCLAHICLGPMRGPGSRKDAEKAADDSASAIVFVYTAIEFGLAPEEIA